jgi:murein DD-endopeptidase MepM/ murein hydrolase activator NlpD
VRFRLAFILVAASAALAATASARAYPWPIKPFDKQHPIRAYFGDPRTRFWNTMLTDGLQGPGVFQFHNGIDIAAPADTAVYPVVSGTARLIDGSAVAVKTGDGRTFQYFHIVPVVVNGQHVVARRTLMGYVMAAYGHVHLSEIRGMKVWNPISSHGISPFQDRTVPEVDGISMRHERSLVALDPDRVCGKVSLVAGAHDTTPLAVMGLFAGFPVSAARVTWSFGKTGTAPLVRNAVAADFRSTLPPRRRFWDVYARGSFQNAPRFSNRQFFMPGSFLYNLAPSLDTRKFRNGVYIVTVTVSDESGNSSNAWQRFTVTNVPGTSSGCPLPPPVDQRPSSSP